MAHNHCNFCVLASCTSKECPVEKCPSGCGASLHGCKIEDHLHSTCPEEKVPCINAQYGCAELLRRKSLVVHLEHCPASVLLCSFAYFRRRRSNEPSLAATPLLDDSFRLGDQATAEEEGSSYSFWLECIPGSTSRYLQPRQRRCFNGGTFPCNEIVRRDEFAAHWKSLHLDIQLNMVGMIERCPMHHCGLCEYGQVELIPNPKGSLIRYDQESRCFLLKPPEIINAEAEPQFSSEYAAKIQAKQELALFGYGDDTEESYDVLGQLPPEVMVKICVFLDSMGLWNLSQVNRYLRSVCRDIARKKGIVYRLWNFDESTQQWILGVQTWSYSRVCSDILSWSHANNPIMGNHMLSCDHLKASIEPYDATILWALPGLTKHNECGVVTRASVVF